MPTEPAGSTLRPWLAWICLPALVLVAYWPGLGGGFVFDDFPNIVNNPALQQKSWTVADLQAAAFSSPASALKRPIAMLSFALNVAASGMDPWFMRLTNVALHALNTLLVFALVRRLLGVPVPAFASLGYQSSWIAAFVAAFWALNPINFMAVLYVVQRMESLSHTFVFIGLWLYLGGRIRQLQGKPGGWSYILAGLVGATGLGIMAKESAALLPLYAFGLEVVLLRFQVNEPGQKPRLTALFVAVLLVPALAGVAWLLPGALAPGAFSARSFSLLERLMTEPRVVMDYLRWILLPDLGQLGLHHDDYQVSRSLFMPRSTLAALGAALLLCTLAWLNRRRRPLASLGIAWFFCAQALTAGFLPLELVYEHRNYFASLGVCLAVADVLLVASRATHAARLASVLAVAYLGYCLLVTTMRSNEWSSPIRFSASEAAKHPRSPRAQYELGRQLVIGTQYRADSPLVPEAYRVLERASSLPDSGVLPEQGLIMLAARTGRPVKAEWWASMESKLSARPLGPQELAALGALTRCAVDRLCALEPARMLSVFGAALQRGDNPELLNIYADFALNVLGDVPLALRLWEEAIRLNPREVQYRANRVMLLIALRKYREASAGITAIRGLGRFGQHAAMADKLDRRMDQARRPSGRSSASSR